MGKHIGFILLAGLAAGSAAATERATGPGPWPVPGFKAPEPNEHPRLFFRKWENVTLDGKRLVLARNAGPWKPTAGLKGNERKRE